MRVCLAALALVAIAAALGTALAWGERAEQGNLIVSLGGGITPRELPRHQLAPVSVSLAGTLSTADNSPLPQLRRIELALAGHGLLFRRGLPLCPRSRLRNSTDSQALERCPGALVARGRLSAQVFVPHQAPFSVDAGLLGFNGRAPGGRAAVWLHAYSSKPPISFVLPFVVRRRSGEFGTALVAAVRRSVGSMPHLSSFQIVFGRRFLYRGRSRSYLSASCPAPPRFTEALLPFARATYAFGASTVTTTIVRGCRAR